MKDEKRTKAELIRELESLRRKARRTDGGAATSASRGMARFRLMYEDSPIGIELYDAGGRLLDVNRACLDIFGILDEEELRGFKLFDDPNLNGAVKRRLKKGESVRYEAPFDFGKVKKSGLYRTGKSGVISLDVLITPISKGRGGYLVQVQDITKRKKAEERLRKSRSELEKKVGERTEELSWANEALRASEAMWRSLVRSAPDIVVTTDRNGRILFINRTQEGIGIKDAVGANLEDYVAAGHQDALKDVLERVFVRGETVTYEIAAQGPEGALSWYSTSAAPVSLDGRTAAAVFISRDITSRKKTEEALRETSVRLRTLVNAIPDMVFFKDAEGRHLIVNRAVEEATGKKAAEIVGKTVDDLLPPEEAEQCRQSDGAVIKAGRPVMADERISKGGETHDLETIKVPLFDDEGCYHGLVVVSRDITGRKKMEEALMVSEEKYRRIMETANDAVFIADPETGLIFDCNQRACELLGRAKHEVIGMHQSGIHPPEEAETYARQFRESADAENYMALNRLVCRKDGGRTVVDISARPFEMGGKKYVQGIFRDVTDRRRIEEQLKANIREKEMLVKEVYHRVKNNLGVISSLLRLQSRQVSDERAKDMLTESQNRVNSMSMIHERLYGSGDLTSVDFADYIRSLAVRLFRSCGLSAADVKLDIDVADASLDVDTIIPCGLIVNELVTNSLKHAFPEGRKGTLRVGFHPSGEHGYLLEVADDGVGFPEGINFRETDTLGMQLVSSLTTQIGGKIELDRAGGTRFRISFKERRFRYP